MKYRMKDLKIGIDIDNTIVNTAETIVKYINDRLPVHLEMSDIKQYYIENALPEQFQWIVEAAFRDSVMWKQVQLVDGAYEYIKKLYDDGHELFFVTSASPENFRKKVSHLERVFDFLPEKYVWKHAINIQQKQMLKLDVMVDDYLDNLLGVREYVSVCLEYPWNTLNTDKVDKDFYRVADWERAYALIDLLRTYGR